MELDKIAIGERIRNVRENILQITRAKLAELCGVTETFIGQIERGEKGFTVETLNKICSISGVESDYILYGKSKNQNLNIRNNIDNILDRCPKRVLMHIYRCLTSLIETILD